MRSALTALGLLFAVGCGKREPPPTQPHAEARATQDETELAGPTGPTPAFLPAHQGSCQRAYQLVHGTCVHRHYEGGDEQQLASALEQYKRGAAPPMLAAKSPARAPEVLPAKKADPGALMRKKAAVEEGALSAKDRRLAELDAMLELAREKLAKREADSKARQVANAPRKARGEPASDDRGGQGIDQLARSVDTGGPRASGDSEGARMDDLARITSQLSGDQLKALSEELGKSGYDAKSVEALLSGASQKQGSR